MKSRSVRESFDALLAENELLHNEVRVARRSSEITAELVVEQFKKMEEIHQKLQEKVHTEQNLQRNLAEKLREAEIREIELEQARQAADAANRTKSTFLANMSHELRTPLNAIIGYSELLEEEACDQGLEEVLVPDLRKINAAGKHLLALINDILDLSKIEAGKFELSPERIDVRAAVLDVASTIQPLIEKNANTLELEFSDDLGHMEADLIRLRQCLFNLLSNASKFTQEGVISVRVWRDEEEAVQWLHFKVKDSGIGMTPEQLAKLFQPFTQADASSTRKYGGTGLGLTITKRFCELMGGSISVESVYGEGSSFQISLPSSALPQMRTETLKTSPESFENLPEGCVRVLAIDDDTSSLDWIRRSLKSPHFQVLTASDGEAGLKLAQELTPDVIVLDVVMPVMDGWAVLGALKSNETTRDIPVILATIHDDRGMGLALGATDYLTKPLEKERLLSVIQRHCSNKCSQVALIVEDDPATRETMRRTLIREGWTVREAENGRVGLSRLEQGLPSIIFLDLMMPEMDGFAFIEALRAREEWRGIPVVVVTAKDLSAAERHQLRSQVDQIIQKGDYQRSDLLAEIRRLVTRATPEGND
ncbi:MAG: response regulator [Myxococcota bacterium]|jgi:signal transduction histidine kinase/CheY-like chemotaxis protein|nr:response regulator [Myxococcota bacterium]